MKLLDLFNIIEQHKAFNQNKSSDTKAKYMNLKSNQKPIAMLITCVDSRIMPEQILGLNPGDIFCLRVIASLVPENDPATNSAIEYAVQHLNIKDIIVMGHSNCGGISALTKDLDESPIKQWLGPWQQQAKLWLDDCSINEQLHCQQQATLKSLANIEKLSFINKNIRLHAWHLDIANTTISVYNNSKQQFSPIG